MFSIKIFISSQTLELHDGEHLVKIYAISSALNGVGERKGSYCTPRGKHIIRAKIGDGQAPNTIFVGRRPTGEMYTPEFAEAHSGRDWILTRILWLSGCERGVNRLGNVDTMQRYIYIHGSPDATQMGVPDSHGCIRMLNNDVIDLFDRVPVGTPVEILE